MEAQASPQDTEPTDVYVQVTVKSISLSCLSVPTRAINCIVWSLFCSLLTAIYRNGLAPAIWCHCCREEGRNQETSWWRRMIRKAQRNVSIYKINISIFCDFVNILEVIMTWQEPFNFHFDPFLLLMDHYGITTRPKALSKVAVPGIEGSPVDCRCPEQVLFHNSRYF